MVSGWGLAASCLYVVRTPNGVVVLPKNSLSFADTYADTRQWTDKDFSSHKALVERLTNTGRDYALPDGDSGSSGDKHDRKKHESDSVDKALWSSGAKAVKSRLVDIALGE